MRVMLALVVLAIALIGVLPSPLVSADDLEMGEGRTSASKEHRADRTVLANFKRDYQAARNEPRSVFEKYLPLVGSATILRFLEETYPACHSEAHDLGKALFA